MHARAHEHTDTHSHTQGYYLLPGAFAKQLITQVVAVSKMAKMEERKKGQ